MGDCLGVDLTAAHVLHRQREPLSILHVLVSNSLDVGLLYLRVFGPDDLSTAVHGHGWFLSAKLYNINIICCRLNVLTFSGFNIVFSNKNTPFYNVLSKHNYNGLP